MTALDPASVPDTGGLAALAGLEMAAGQLTPLVTVLRAEQARRTAGIAISRPARCAHRVTVRWAIRLRLLPR
jgi:hypothetical protein